MEEMTKMASVPVENEVQQYMMSAWAGFARKPKTALTELGWPKYNATSTSSQFYSSSTLERFLCGGE
jgi:hypothetical protein